MRNEEVSSRILKKAANADSNILLIGPKGLGQEKLAEKAIAAFLGCGEAAGNIEAHPDVIVIQGERGKNIVLEDIEPLDDFLSCFPAKGRCRVVLLKGADRITAAAANSLLKKMEEGKARYVLLSDTDKVMPTISSRCAVYELHPLEFGRFAEELSEEEDTEYWYAVTGGCPGMIETIKEDEERACLYSEAYKAYQQKDRLSLLKSLGLLAEKDRHSVFNEHREDVTPLLMMMQTAAYLKFAAADRGERKALYKEIGALGKEVSRSKVASYSANELAAFILLELNGK